MKNLLYAAGAVIVSVALSVLLVGNKVVAPKFGSYNPNQPEYTGFSQTLSTSTAFANGFLCTSNVNVLFTGTSAVATGTFAAATTSYAACGNPPLGVVTTGQITNNGTNTINLVGGTGITFLCENTGPGTTTVQGVCTNTQASISATSSLYYQAYFDTGSSSLKVLVGNQWH